MNLIFKFGRITIAATIVHTGQDKAKPEFTLVNPLNVKDHKGNRCIYLMLLQVKDFKFQVFIV